MCHSRSHSRISRDGCFLDGHCADDLCSPAYTVDQKYLTPTQIVEVSYEGRSRRFVASSVSEEGDDSRVDDLTGALSALSLSREAPPRLWTVDWNVTVRLEQSEEQSIGDETEKGVCQFPPPARSRR